MLPESQFAGDPAHSTVLVHLSDIHFKHLVGGDIWDLDGDLRNELERDLGSVLAELGPAQAILVTGDISFSATNDEYRDAADWLRSVARIARCRENDVLMVPGNHDVDRSRVASSRTLQEFHARLRECDIGELDDLLYEYLVSDEIGGDAYLAPLRNYVSFATRYECAITAQQPYWEHVLPIGTSRYKLRIRGMTTALISDRYDDSEANRLVLGGMQASIHREPATVVMTLAHHPPTWLRDGEAISQALGPRSNIQLWGHGHAFSAVEENHSLHLFAGAVHPERGSLEYEPRYNVLRIDLVEDGPRASVALYARVWDPDTRRFGVDSAAGGDPVQVFAIAVEPILEPLPTEAREREEPAVLESQRTAKRDLAFRFSSLPYQRRLSVARQLDLLDADSRPATDQELFDSVLSRAVELNMLADLWAAVRSEAGAPDAPNPFDPESS